MTVLISMAALAWVLVSRYPEIDRAYLSAILLITLVYAAFAVFWAGRVRLLLPVTSPSLRRLQALQNWAGLVLFLFAVTLPAVLIASGVLPGGANLVGLWIFILWNPLSAWWFGARTKAEVKSILAGLVPGPLPPGMSERVAAMAVGGDFARAMFAYRLENRGASLKQAREAVDAYLSGCVKRTPPG